MCEDKEEVRSEAVESPKRLCWPRRPPAPLPDTRGLCCAKLLRKNGKSKKVSDASKYTHGVYVSKHPITVYGLRTTYTS